VRSPNCELAPTAVVVAPERRARVLAGYRSPALHGPSARSPPFPGLSPLMRSAGQSHPDEDTSARTAHISVGSRRITGSTGLLMAKARRCWRPRWRPMLAVAHDGRRCRFSHSARDVGVRSRLVVPRAVLSTLREHERPCVGAGDEHAGNAPIGPVTPAGPDLGRLPPRMLVLCPWAKGERRRGSHSLRRHRRARRPHAATRRAAAAAPWARKSPARPVAP